MGMVSTGGALLNALKLENQIYASVVALDGEEQDQQAPSLWNIPGFGMVSVGGAVAALVHAYLTNPEVRETIADTIDFFDGVMPAVDAAKGLTQEKAEEIGKQAEKYTGQAPKAEGELSKSSVKPVEVEAPKPTEFVPQPTPVAEAASALVNSGSKLPELNTSGAPYVPGARRATPSASIRNILQNTAKTEGVEFGTLYALGGSESSFRSGISSRNSSATGLFQFTDRTWAYLTQKVWPELGYTSQDRLDPQKSAIVAARYIKNIQATLAKEVGGTPTLGQTYLGYFMGPSGAVKFLQALKKNPDQKGSEIFPSAAASNPQLFYAKGDRKKPLTLRQTLDQLEGKVNAYYKDATQATPVPDPSVAVDTGGADAPAPIAPISTKPAMATPQVQAVPVPDFNAVSPKNEARVPQSPQNNPKQKEVASSTLATSGGKPVQGEVQFFRDKNNRLLSVRG